MAASETIQPLVDRYTYHRDAYLRGQEKYNETQLRQDFIDPLFHALGWDVTNNKGFSEAYREVVLEEPVRIRGKTYYFDYTFRIGGVRKFIVETKKPSVAIKDDADAALQLRRYAWNARLPLSILTNFEEFAIYDCTIKPETSDNATKGRIEYFTYKDLPEKWDYLVSIFSQDCILKGSFDRYADSQKGKKGTATVDDDILTEIESWRDALAKNIALRNPSLSVDELNTVVQRTIDRLIFLRICEDRGIEEYTTLHKLLEGEHVYARLCELFKQADAKYNSGLFHFEKEQDWDEMPDTLSLALVIDDKVLKGVIKRLYYPETPYLFSVIPPAILGHVYEQFLGKVIRLTDGHQAKVEYKPEVKKAGGVFYTPQYIVEYIVKHTVGELVKDKTPRDVAKLRILDPACGSGSFLIGAFQYLLDWHRDWYIANLVPVFIEKKSVTDPAVLALLPEPTPRGKKKLSQVELPIYKAGSSGDTTRTRSDWRLTTAEKKRILLNNIYGVDIDHQAVEVTKLSLLLKVLEEENEENIDKQLKLFAERALPSLHENIKCGNSLIGWDVMTPDMPADEIKRINPFDWDTEFADIVKAGGFDAVIGNPPYVRMEGFKEVKDYLKSHYASHEERADLYTYFIEKEHKILRSNGNFGMIVSNKFLRANYGAPLRKFIQQNVQLKQISDFAGLPVFPNATVRTIVILSENAKQTNYTFDYAPPPSMDQFSTISGGSIPLDRIIEASNRSISASVLTQEYWSFADQDSELLLKTLKSRSQSLDNYSNHQILMGIKSGLTEAFVIDPQTRKKIIEANPSAQEIIKPFLNGKNIRRYSLDSENIFLIYTHHGINIVDYPAVIEHLKPFSSKLKNRVTKQEWYELQQPQYGYKSQLDNPKIVFPDIAKGPRFYLDMDGHYCSNTVYFIPGQDLFLLGLLNSKVGFFYFKNKCAGLEGKNEIYLRFFGQYLKEFPVRTINFSDPADKARHDRMVTLVTKMLDLNKKVQDARLELEKTQLSRQIEATDAAIDKQVYELYGLTKEEIAIVEETSGK